MDLTITPSKSHLIEFTVEYSDPIASHLAFIDSMTFALKQSRGVEDLTRSLEGFDVVKFFTKAWNAIKDFIKRLALAIMSFFQKIGIWIRSKFAKHQGELYEQYKDKLPALLNAHGEATRIRAKKPTHPRVFIEILEQAQDCLTNFAAQDIVNYAATFTTNLRNATRDEDPSKWNVQKIVSLASFGLKTMDIPGKIVSQISFNNPKLRSSRLNSFNTTGQFVTANEMPKNAANILIYDDASDNLTGTRDMSVTDFLGNAEGFSVLSKNYLETMQRLFSVAQAQASKLKLFENQVGVIQGACDQVAISISDKSITDTTLKLQIVGGLRQTIDLLNSARILHVYLSTILITVYNSYLRHRTYVESCVKALTSPANLASVPSNVQVTT